MRYHDHGYHREIKNETGTGSRANARGSQKQSVIPFERHALAAFLLVYEILNRSNDYRENRDQDGRYDGLDLNESDITDDHLDDLTQRVHVS